MKYIQEESKVLYQSKYGVDKKEFGAQNWFATLCLHIPNKGGQMVRYYVYYSNVCKGRIGKENTHELDFCIIAEGKCIKQSRKSWARLIKNIYEVGPLTCSKCNGDMKIIAFIEDYKFVKKILD